MQPGMTYTGHALNSPINYYVYAGVIYLSTRLHCAFITLSCSQWNVILCEVLSTRHPLRKHVQLADRRHQIIAYQTI
ncbi:hypothetical protein EB796_024527 [Bugula neritina]|uniref:Uncharacterized protein n=1 Tax=Bugula neritina TaxID=10212 RepID=A0A7J7ITH8_BUGNE|nr:hypothetical protein EB796_024527 [Bugula neritina]